ncbi:hypothetical protein MMC29_005045 [Sticta canariensis]|nr:hypothetical protein [Sticta canariensis]
MATSSLVQAHSPILWSTICDTAEDSISASLESKYPLTSVIEAVKSTNTATASSGSDFHVTHAGHVARHVGRYASCAALATHAADIKTITEAVNSANTAAATSDRNLHVVHAGHVARHVARYASRAAFATHAADIKTITETIRLTGVREEASTLIPTTSANDPAALFTTGTSHHSVFTTFGPDRFKMYENHAPQIVPTISIPIIPIIFIAVMIGLIITGILIGFLARWLRKRRLLSRLHASRQDELSGTTREGRNADVPSPLSSGTTITPASAAGRQRLPTGKEAIV